MVQEVFKPLDERIQKMMNLQPDLVSVRTPVWPNFIKIEAHDRKSHIMLKVTALSPEVASTLWDQWKADWLAHCARKSA